MPDATASRGRLMPAITRLAAGGGGHSFGVGGGEIDHQSHHRHRLERQRAGCPGRAPRSARERGGRPHQQAAVTGLEMDAVVGDQAGERQQRRCRRPASSASASRDLPAAGRPADQHGARARPAPPRRGRSELRRRHHIAGSRTMKRAPSTAGASSAAPARHAVLHPDAAAMRLDDLLGDRQAQVPNSGRSPGAAGRCRSARRSSRSASGATPGPSSSTTISTSFFSRRQVTRTVPPGGENERALSIRLSITWPSREFVAGHHEGAPARRPRRSGSPARRRRAAPRWRRRPRC